MHHRDASSDTVIAILSLFYSISAFFFSHGLKTPAVCLPSALWEAPWVVSDADSAGVWVLALFLKLLRHTVVSF
jgi:hypothetical protein